ncbi:MAG: DUF2974 domain-containing protein [Lachnospiraceae bacterium]|nr:DUF2974 domain-containing protein [Lachnospiraceae bacterium]
MIDYSLEAAVLARLAYKDCKKDINELIRKYHGKIPLKEFLSEEDYNDLLSTGVPKSELDNWKIVGVYDKNQILDVGMYACIVETEPGRALVGFRGSELGEGARKAEDLVKDWGLADFGLLNSTCTTQQLEVDKFLDRYRDLLSQYDRITFAGHSLGGNLAEYATIMSSYYGIDDCIERCVSIDGPGFSNEFLLENEALIQKMKSRMYHYKCSLVGNLLNVVSGHILIADVAADPNGNYNGRDKDGDFSAVPGSVYHSLEYLNLSGGKININSERFDEASGVVGISSKGLDNTGFNIFQNPFRSVTKNYLHLKNQIINYQATTKKVKSVKKIRIDRRLQYERYEVLKIDIDKLYEYASRIDKVNIRIVELDKRMDKLYYKVGWLDLYNLITADILVGYSTLLKRCSEYLKNTAEDFSNVENCINQKFYEV